MLVDLPYGTGTLAEVLPSAAAAVGGPFRAALGLPAADAVVVLVADGLGHVGLSAAAGAAPFLSGLAARAISTGFPSTTSTSLASIGTGLPPGGHGLVGYLTVLDPPSGEPINWLGWSGANSGKDLRERYVPEDVQPRPTVFERAAAAGIATHVVASGAFRTSGLTRAVLRGAAYHPVSTPADLVTGVLAALGSSGGPRLVYAYLPEQDLVGHVRGPASDTWAMQLTLFDRAVELLADRLPPRTLLVVTADHGMVEVPDDAKVDYDLDPELRAGVAGLAGEGRARIVFTADGERDEVRGRWERVLGDRADVLTSAAAVARGLFGPVEPEFVARLGDLVVVARGQTAIVRTHAEPNLARMRGHHGALSDAECLVPLLTLLG